MLVAVNGRAMTLVVLLCLGNCMARQEKSLITMESDPRLPDQRDDTKGTKEDTTTKDTNI